MVVFLLPTTMEDQKTTDIKVIFGLTLVHFIGDFYSSFINPLLPVFVEKVCSYLGTGRSHCRNKPFFSLFIIQPSVGYLADHYRTRFFVLGGPLLAIVFISLVGIAPCFLVLLFFISIGSNRFVYVSSFGCRYDLCFIRVGISGFLCQFSMWVGHLPLEWALYLSPI